MDADGLQGRLRTFDMYVNGLAGLVTGGTVAPAWTPDGSALGFVDGPADARIAWQVDLGTGEKTPLIDAEKARAAIADATGQTPPGRGVPFDRFEFSGAGEIRCEVGGTPLALDLATCQARALPGPPIADELYGVSERLRATPGEYLRSSRVGDPFPALEVPSPDGAFLLSTEGFNIVARSTYDGRKVRLTEDGTAGREWRFDAPTLLSAAAGLPETGACWSPDGRKIASYTVDLRGVYQAPQVHYLKARDEVVYRYLAKAGGVMERTTLYVLDLYGPPVELDLADTTDTYPVTAAWLPDASAVVVFQMSRDCTRADVLLADAATGRVTPVFSEHGESFIRIQHDVYAQVGPPRLGLWLTPDGQQLIWQSERSGWRHLYLYDLDGTLVRQLTDGAWPVEDLIAVRGGYVYFTGHKDQARPYDLHYYRVPLEGGAVEPLTEAPGVHGVTVAPSGTAFLDTHSSCSRPPVVELRTAAGRRLAEISRADISKLEAAGYTPPEQFTVTAADGQAELWGVMFKPHDFDPARQYPVIEWIYGGPQTVVVPHGFIGQELWSQPVLAQALAQLDYVTVILDSRGTPGRSKAFHDASYRRWANVLADDHAEAIRQLAARHCFIDPARVGIIGHSWGGYSAFRCLADRADTYKAAVCSMPAFDPYGSLLYECYLDLPQNNPHGYAFASTFPLAATIEGALMITVGTSDHAMWTDAVKMSEALIRAGKLHEFVVLPEQYHTYDSVHDAYYWRKVAQFFARHLG
jgi:dipeptidyl aminopeptidase/acylaminoacyl peptidase